MQTRVAVMAVIVEEKESAEKLNAVLHEFGDYIIGRMGIPYKAKGINFVWIALESQQDTIWSLGGGIVIIAGVSVKTAYSNVIGDE